MRDLILIVVVVAISACDSQMTGPDYPLELHVRGIVTPAADGRPIHQAKVILGKTGFIHGEGLTETVTNQSGEYEIRFVAQEDDCPIFGLYVTVVAQGYVTTILGSSSDPRPKCREGVQEINAVLAPIPD